MSSLEKDVKDVEMSVNNSHLRPKKVEDRVDGFVTLLCRYSDISLTNNWSLGLKVQQVQREARADHKSLLGKFATNNTIIDRKFIWFDEELERVVDLVREKIKTEMGSIASDFSEVMCHNFTLLAMFFGHLLSTFHIKFTQYSKSLCKKTQKQFIMITPWH
jgi:hypothetical protein